LRDLGLKREDIAEVAVVLLRPDGLFGGSRDEARGNANPIAGLQYGTFDDSINIEFAGDFAQRERGVFELHHGLAGDDAKIGALAELSDELFGHAVGKEFALGISREIRERKHGDGFDARGG